MGSLGWGLLVGSLHSRVKRWTCHTSKKNSWYPIQFVAISMVCLFLLRNFCKYWKATWDNFVIGSLNSCIYCVSFEYILYVSKCKKKYLIFLDDVFNFCIVSCTLDYPYWIVDSFQSKKIVIIQVTRQRINLSSFKL